MKNLHEFASSKPIVTGTVGTITGWGTALIAYIDAANHVLAFVGTFCGSVAALYTMLIIIRRYHLGAAEEKNS